MSSRVNEPWRRLDSFVESGASMMSERLARFRERLEEAIGGRKNAMRFAKEHPIATYRTIQRWIDGESWPDAAETLALSQATGKPVSYFFEEATPPAAKIINIPVLDARAAAGAGASADVVSAVGSLPFPTEFVRKIAPPDCQLSCLRCHGNSMAPTIEDGAILIIDERQKKPRAFKPHPRKSLRLRPPPDEIFVFYQSGDLRLKRLRDIGDGFLAILSDNQAEHPLEIIKQGRDGSLHIIGKVVWWDNRL